jgi:hypothetical protein
MNKYEILFAEILKQTKGGDLHWKQSRRQANSDLIFNPGLVFRQFTADFKRAGHEYRLLLVEKKYDDPDHDFAFEKYMSELLILDGGELITTLTDSVIERSQLIQLTNIVETNSDKANKLFEAGS